MSTLESERLDRIEQHLKLLKEDSNTRSADIKEIKQALLGNALNDYKGLVWKISDMAKGIVAAFIVALVTLIFKAFKA